MAGLPPPPPPPPPPTPPSGPSYPPAPLPARGGPASQPPAGPPIRRPDATLPQPEPPVPVLPDRGPRRLTLRQLTVALLIVAILGASAVAAVVLFGGGDSLDTAAAADNVRDIVDELQQSDSSERCGIDLEGAIERVSEELDSDVVYDALDLGDPRMTADTAPGGTSSLNCSLTLTSGSAPVGVLFIPVSGDGDFDQLVDEIGRDRRVRSAHSHHGGDAVTYVTRGDGASGTRTGALWGDDHLVVLLGVEAPAGAASDVDAAELATALETILPDLVDDLVEH